jgi:hypothetical protein
MDYRKKYLKKLMENQNNNQLSYFKGEIMNEKAPSTQK